MLERGFQPFAVSGAVFDAGAKGIDLDPLAVMLFKQVSQQQADRMGAEIARQIADAQALMLVVAPCGQVTASLLQLALEQGMRGQQLQCRVILRVQHGQGRGGHDHGVGADAAKRLVHRPDALAMPQLDPMLQRAGLLGVEFQAAAQRGFGQRVTLLDFSQAPDPVQQLHQHVPLLGQFQPGMIGHTLPAGQGFVGPSQRFKLAAQVEPGLEQLGVDRDCGPVSGFGTDMVGFRAQQDAEVELRDKNQGLLRAADRGDPLAVKGNA